MAEVGQSQQFSLFHRLECLSHEHAVHDDVGTQWKVCYRELVLGGYARNQRIVSSPELNLVSLLQLIQGDQDVISGVELEDFLHFATVFGSSSLALAQIAIGNPNGTRNHLMN